MLDGLSARAKAAGKIGIVIATAIGAVAIDFTSKFLSMIADSGFEIVMLIVALPVLWREFTREKK
jgi:hypothetical protein